MWQFNLSYAWARGSLIIAPSIIDQRVSNGSAGNLHMHQWSIYLNKCCRVTPHPSGIMGSMGKLIIFSTAWQHFGLMWITHPLGQTSRSSRAVALARNGPFSLADPCQVLGPYGWKLHSYGKQMCSKAIAKLHESIREEGRKRSLFRVRKRRHALKADIFP